MFMGTAAISAAFWVLSLVTSRGRDDDPSYGAEYGRGLAELTGVMTILSVFLGTTLLLGAAVGLSAAVGWTIALVVSLASLWVVRTVGQRWPGLRLPTTWRASE